MAAEFFDNEDPTIQILIPLSYEDTISFCQSNKSMAKYCETFSVWYNKAKFRVEDRVDPEMLKERVRLGEKPSVFYDKVLNKFNRKVDEIIQIHYPNLPAWVDKKLFAEDMRERIRQDIELQIDEGYTETLDDGTLDPESTIDLSRILGPVLVSEDWDNIVNIDLYNGYYELDEFYV